MSKKGHTNNLHGRPPRVNGESQIKPARQLGRVSDSEWEELQKAAKNCGLSFTQWALAILLTMARKQNKRGVK